MKDRAVTRHWENTPYPTGDLLKSIQFCIS
jgi:hypothetical protein